RAELGAEPEPGAEPDAELRSGPTGSLPARGEERLRARGLGLEEAGERGGAVDLRTHDRPRGLAREQLRAGCRAEEELAAAGRAGNAAVVAGSNVDAQLARPGENAHVAGEEEPHHPAVRPVAEVFARLAARDPQLRPDAQPEGPVPFPQEPRVHADAHVGEGVR